MIKSVTWPAALGFVLGIGLVVLLKSNVPSGGEPLRPVGVGLILAVSAAIGALIGAVAKWLFGGGPEEKP